jgi:hypothetical protein
MFDIRYQEGTSRIRSLSCTNITGNKPNFRDSCVRKPFSKPTWSTLVFDTVGKVLTVVVLSSVTENRKQRLSMYLLVSFLFAVYFTMNI